MMESTNTMCSGGTIALSDDHHQSSNISFNFIDELDASNQGKTLRDKLEEKHSQAHATASNEPVVISEQESAKVHRFKIIVLTVLFLVTITVSTCVHIIITKSEQARFEQKFQSDASKVLEAVRVSIDNTLMPMDSLALALASHAKAQNDTWPFVTIPDYGARVAKTLPLADSIWISVLPVVTPANRLQWEEYSRTHDSWVEESFLIQDTWDHYHGPKNISFDREPNEHITGNYGPLESNVSRIMLPQWQTFPSVPVGVPAYNYDWLAVTEPQSLLDCYLTHRSILAEPYLLPYPDDPATLEQELGWLENFRYFIGPDEEAYEPVMDIYYPIMDNTINVDFLGDDNYNETNHNIVGVLAATVYWRNLFRDTLPPGSSGISVVVANTCSKSFTYQINGPDVMFISADDKHETKYDHVNVYAKITDLEENSYVASVYAGAPISKEYCPYTLQLHPTSQMQSDMSSNNAAIFTSATVLLAIGLCLLFLMYDFKVERRQKKVLQSAVRSSEIVSSLFPSTVRDQLYPIQEKNEMSCSSIWPIKSKSEGLQTTAHTSDGQIATLYPETTVMFADIKGFTLWSSSREPTQVFQLLEALYAGFDELAKVHGVFKVETIGDTYVAVAGLPNARQHHAVVMAYFAKECLEKMTMITRQLEPTLGPGTADLTLRVGLNSGPTTAGVLRGEKARFQLFGDTVNTASRMESNGESNRIHVSESTAKLIENDGKEHWLTARDIQIMVKGKGYMQTYWCDICHNTIMVGVDDKSTIPTCSNKGDSEDGSVHKKFQNDNDVWDL